MTQEAVRVAAVVVLYRPGPEVIDNIRSWLGQVERAFIVDNTEGDNLALVAPLLEEGRADYLPNRANLGVAKGLNIGAGHAIAAGYRYLLTMDQDSEAVPGMVSELLTGFEQEGVQAGMVVPFLLTCPGQSAPSVPGFRSLLTAMTSGSLLDLAAYRAAGPYRDDFFIDFIDNEYCLRLVSSGYSVVQASRAVLRHTVGQRVNFVVSGQRLGVTTHPPVRKYYKTRNRCVVWDLYGTDFPAYCWRDRFRFILELVRLIALEPDKISKIRMVFKGWMDYRRGVMGVFKEIVP